MDQPTNTVDLLLRWKGITSGPLFEPWDGARQPFPVLEQGQEVVAQFGLVGRVGAEVRAPEALKPEGTGPPGGTDVGGLGAVTEGYATSPS